MHDHDNHHEHGHTHAPEHDHAHNHEHEAAHSHDGILKNKTEAAAFLQYTLSHNAHHEEELNGLVHSLQHLALHKEASEITACIGELARVNSRLDAVLKSLK